MFGRDACFGTAEIQIRRQILDHYLLLDSGLNNYEIIHAALGDTQRAGRRATVKPCTAVELCTAVQPAVVRLYRSAAAVVQLTFFLKADLSHYF